MDNDLPACLQAAIILSQSSTFNAIGFSQITCLPALAARIVYLHAWSWAIHIYNVNIRIVFNAIKVFVIVMFLSGILYFSFHTGILEGVPVTILLNNNYWFVIEQELTDRLHTHQDLPGQFLICLPFLFCSTIISGFDFLSSAHLMPDEISGTLNPASPRSYKNFLLDLLCCSMVLRFNKYKVLYAECYDHLPEFLHVFPGDPGRHSFSRPGFHTPFTNFPSSTLIKPAFLFFAFGVNVITNLCLLHKIHQVQQ
jgi:hypothetical protein